MSGSKSKKADFELQKELANAESVLVSAYHSDGFGDHVKGCNLKQLEEREKPRAQHTKIAILYVTARFAF